ncbi:MAG: TetR/AcrR family transcriptional regulator [Ignavibacteriae bacterium]|nr:TetR/AcrR family transcriptional regulator [Ignavibacteriota bacterium]
MTVQDRRERERELRRQAILDAAGRVFFRSGPGATMDEIAAEAEVAKGTLYLYFPSKEDVYLTLLVKALDALHAEFAESARTASDPLSQIHAIGDCFVRFSESSPGQFRLLHESSYPFVHANASPAILGDVHSRSTNIWELITRILQRGIDEGLFRDDLSAFEMAIILWTNTSGLLRLIDARRTSTIWQKRGGAYSLAALDLRALIDVANSMLVRSLLRGGPPIG